MYKKLMFDLFSLSFFCDINQFNFILSYPIWICLEKKIIWILNFNNLYNQMQRTMVSVPTNQRSKFQPSPPSSYVVSKNTSKNLYNFPLPFSDCSHRQRRKNGEQFLRSIRILIRSYSSCIVDLLFLFFPTFFSLSDVLYAKFLLLLMLFFFVCFDLVDR